ncbi:hypothetical protein EVAR_91891_1, partial [Eumeta japonica]
SCRMLERMDLEECVLITDSTLVHLAMGCPRLEKLVYVASILILISVVTLSHCELITDYGIKQLSMSPCAAEHLTVLGLDNCPLVTDGALEHLTSCHNLQLIELYDCQLVTRNAIRKLRVHAYFAPVTPQRRAPAADRATAAAATSFEDDPRTRPRHRTARHDSRDVRRRCTARCRIP